MGLAQLAQFGQIFRVLFRIRQGQLVGVLVNHCKGVVDMGQNFGGDIGAVVISSGGAVAVEVPGGHDAGSGRGGCQQQGAQQGRKYADRSHEMTYLLSFLLASVSHQHFTRNALALARLELW